MSKNNSKRDEYGNGAVAISLNGQQVQSVTRGEGNTIEAFHLADGTEISYDDAIQAVESGNAEGLIAQQGNKGQTILRSKPDGEDFNNLDNLPSFQ